MTSSDKAILTAISLSFAAAVFGIGGTVGKHQERQRNRQAAIAAGVAEYVITDPATGKTEFRWKNLEKLP